MSGRVVALVAGALAIGLLLGCGGGSDDDSASVGAASTDSSSGSTESGTTRKESGTDGTERSGASGSGGGSSGSQNSGSGRSGTDSKGDGSTQPGGDESGAGSGAPSSNATFVKEVNAICSSQSEKFLAEAKATFAKGAKQPNTGLDPAIIVDEILVPGLEAEAAEIRALDIPPKAKQQVEAMLAALEEVVVQARADPKSLVGQSRPYAEVEKLADAYRLTKCPVG